MNGGAGEVRTPDLRFRNLIDIPIVFVFNPFSLLTALLFGSSNLKPFNWTFLASSGSGKHLLMKYFGFIKTHTQTFRLKS